MCAFDAHVQDGVVGMQQVLARPHEEGSRRSGTFIESARSQQQGSHSKLCDKTFGKEASVVFRRGIVFACASRFSSLVYMHTVTVRIYILKYPQVYLRIDTCTTHTVRSQTN